MLDSLIGVVKATEPAANAPVITPIAPQAPTSSSASGTFNNLAPSGSSSSSSGNALVDAFVPKIKNEDAAAIDGAILPAQDVYNAGALQAHQALTKSLNLLDDAGAVAGGAFCYPKTEDELHHAIEDSGCTIIALSGQVSEGSRL